MVEQEKYNQQFASQLIKIEKDLRKITEVLLCMVIQEMELNQLTLKTLQVQFNVMELKPVEVDKALATLMKRVKDYSERIKDVSNTLSLSAPNTE